MQTYLATVIQRLFLEQRVHMWGKWRPSAEAKRLGDKAITLERLLTRDGHSFQEAVQILTTGIRPEYSRHELEAIYSRLPVRTPRPVLVSDAAAAESIPDSRATDEDLLLDESEKAMRAAAKAIDDAIARMEPEDQIILRMRFWSDRRVGDIAGALGLDPKKTYKRLDRMLAGLRTELVRAGVEAPEVDAMIARGKFEAGHSQEVGAR